MKSILIIVVALVALTVFYSCNRNKKSQVANTDSEATTTDNEASDEKAASVTNSVLNDVYGVVKVGETKISPEVGMTIEMQLQEGAIKGNGGCNNYFGKLALEGEKLTISENRATKMACPNLALEQQFFANMRKVNGYKAKGGVLFLTADGSVLIEARRMD